MSHRGELTGRIVELLLLLAEKPYTQKQLIEHFGVNRKTVKRLIDEICRHYPVTEEKTGREVAYKFLDGYKFVPPQLTTNEVAALLLAREAIAATGAAKGAFGSPFAARTRSLLTKLRASLPASLGEKIEILADVFGSAVVPAKDYSHYAATIDLLTEAALQQRQVKLNYFSLTDGKTKPRTVNPFCVYFDPDGATLKLLGFDSRRRAVIPFSIDHIRSLQITDAKFVKPADFNLQNYLNENCFNGIHGAPVVVRLRATGQTARIFAERQFHPSQTVLRSNVPCDRDETIIEMRVASGRGLERFILGWLPEIEVLAPAELREKIQNILRLAQV